MGLGNGAGFTFRATTGPSPARINKYEGGNLVDDGTRTFVYENWGRVQISLLAPATGSQFNTLPA